MKVLAVEFVKSAAGTEDLPRDGLPEIAFVGRSNVGKSSLINALVRRRIARTSAAPGKTRLANLYRVRVPAGAMAPAGADSPSRSRREGDGFYLVDLPGYGYARGGDHSARSFERLTAAYFLVDVPTGGERAPRPAIAGVVLAIDARHPGLAADERAHEWLSRLAVPIVRVATKVDRMRRSERARALRALQTRFDGPVQPISAVTGEGLDELWKQIIRLCNSPRNRPPSISPR